MHLFLQAVHGIGWDLTGWILLTLAAELMALLTVPSVLLERRGQPLSALSWTLSLVALPFVGVAAWWLIGRAHLKRKRRRRAQARWRIAKGFAELRPGALPAAGLEQSPLPFRRLPAAEASGIFPFVGGNRVTLLRDGDETYAALEELLRGARHHLHLLFYTWEPDAAGARFRDLLVARAREGVQVRLLLDALGSARTGDAFLRPLIRAGGRVAFFAPMKFLRRSLSINFRNHRKIAVADGHAAYTGGLNVGDCYTREWRDMGVRLVGPAASQLQEVFLEDWFFSTGEALAERDYLCWREAEGLDPAGPDFCAVVAGGPDTEQNVTRDAFFVAINAARERVWITTPYFIPDSSTQTALRTAVYRGVDVRLLVPRKADLPWTRLAGRSYFPSLLKSGVKIFEYRPCVLHAKTWVFDRLGAAVGSANLDTRSLKLNFEVSCFLHGRGPNARLAELFEEDLRHSDAVSLDSVEKGNSLQRLAESALNLLSPLL